MGKKAASVIVIVDLDSPASDACCDLPSRHRTCWKHTEACLRARRKRLTKQQAQQIDGFKKTSPCFSATFPHRQRSTRTFNCKLAISRLTKKLDTEAFECYFKNLWKSFSDDKRMPFTYLDSLWFSMYMKPRSKANVLTWIKKKDIFSKKYVLVPIVHWSHWNLLVFCHFGDSSQSESSTPCMLLLDSLQMANPRRLEPQIRKFVSDIYKSEGRPEDKKFVSQIPLLVPKVPQQRNDEECGNYVLCFINLFVQDAPESFSMEGYPYFMKDNWFGPECLERFCEKLESLKSDPH